MQSPNILVIRFSSFGDVLQSLSIVGRLKEEWPNAKIHFVTRSEFAHLVEEHPGVFRVWCLNKREGLKGLMRLSSGLNGENWTHVYDSHNNLRSRILCFFLNGPFGIRRLWKGHKFIRRSIQRWKRFLLFRFRINKFEQPFSGQRDLLKPLEKWGVSFRLPEVPQLYFSSKSKEFESMSLPDEYVTLAPSAAHELKRWPLNHWKDLIEKMPNSSFVVLGGPEDDFLKELVKVDSARVFNMAGKLSLAESSRLVISSQLLVSNDTGLMHVAEQAGTSCVALMGPAPFGFPSRPRTKVMELDLPCRPCSKHGQGPCVNKDKFHKCMVDISPDQVVAVANQLLSGGSENA